MENIVFFLWVLVFGLKAMTIMLDTLEVRVPYLQSRGASDLPKRDLEPLKGDLGLLHRGVRVGI